MGRAKPRCKLLFARSEPKIVVVVALDLWLVRFDLLYSLANGFVQSHEAFMPLFGCGVLWASLGGFLGLRCKLRL